MKRIVVLALSLAGCQPPPSPPKPAAPAPLAAQFDAKTTGVIRGSVFWTGARPEVESIKLPFPLPGLESEQPNPNAPRIDPKTQAVADVLVYLRTVDPARSRPWPHDPVEVAFAGSRLEVRQSKQKGRFGIVRRGDDIVCIAHEARKHTLEARGASVFSLPLLMSGNTTKRQLDQPGILELSSGSALYWLRGYLWIGEHPYAAATNAAGEFQLDQVPAGAYELVCWSPNWRIKRRERHPEFGEIERLIFDDGVEQSADVMVAAGDAAVASFRWSEANFPLR
jgi:hypothetical protein